MKVGTLIVDIAANLARLQQDMAQARGIVETGSREIERSIGIAKSALGALGITLSAGFFAKWVEGSYAAQASMLRFAQTAGTTVEAFSALKPVMKDSQTDAETVATGMQKLAKSMAESGDGTTKAAKVFGALKVSVTDAAGGMRSTQDVMRELGGKLMSMKDQTLAVAFAQEVLGKSGANLLPFLYELARSGELQAKVTLEQAKAAKEFEDNLNRLKSSSEQFRNHLANEMLPTLNTLLEKLNAIKAAEGGGFVGFMAKLGITGGQTDDPIKSVQELDDKIAFLQQRLNDLRFPDPTGFFGQFASLQRLFNSDDIAITEQQVAYAQKQRQVLDIMAVGQRRRMAGDPNSPLFEFAGGGIPTEPRNPLGESDALAKRYANTLQALTKEYFNLTHAGQFANVMYEVTEGTLSKLNIEQKAHLLAMAGQIDDYRNIAIAAEQAAESTRALLEPQIKAREVLSDLSQKYGEQTEQLKTDVFYIGMSAREIEKANAVRQIELDVRQQLARLPRDEATGDIAPYALGTARDIRASAEAQKRAVLDLVDARQKAERDWLTGVRSGMNEYVDISTNAAAMSKQLFLDAFQGMEDALVKFVMTGKLQLKDLVQTIEADLLRILIRQQITGPLAASAGGIFGGLGALFGFGAAGGAAAAGGSLSHLVPAGAGVGAGAGAASFSWAPPIAASLAMYYAYQSGAGAQAMNRQLPIFNKVGTAVDTIFPGLGSSLFGSGRGTKNPQLGLVAGPGGTVYASQSDLGGDDFAQVLAQLTTQLNDRTKYDRTMLAQMVGMMSGSPGTSPDQMLAMLMQKLSGAALPDLGALTAQRGQLTAQLRSTLGVDSLQAFRDSLKTSDLGGGSPMDQLGAARDIFQRDFAAVKGGDFSRIGAFEQEASSYLSLGRGVYASGGGFQDIRAEVDAALAQVGSQQNDILKDLPGVILQSSSDQVAAIKAQTDDLVAQLKDLGTKIERVESVIGRGP